MPAPITLPPFDEQLQAELHQRYEEAGDAEMRTRYQMIVLAWCCAARIPLSEYSTASSREDWTRFLGGAHQAGSAPSHRPGKPSCCA